MVPPPSRVMFQTWSSERPCSRVQLSNTPKPIRRASPRPLLPIQSEPSRSTSIAVTAEYGKLSS